MTEEGSLRERLIDVGVELVLDQGSAFVGLREIARRAGVSHGAPRRYFPTHHALLSAIARRGFEDLGARFEAAVDGTVDGTAAGTAAGTAPETATPRGQLEALARAYVGYARERRGMFELMFRHDLLDSTAQASAPASATATASDGPRLRESTLPLFGHLTALVARCRPEHEAAPSPAVTAAALWANLHGVAQLWTWGSLQLAFGTPGADGAPGDDQRDRLITAVLDAHLGPLDPLGPAAG